MNAIVDKLAEDESIAALYEEWLRQRREIIRTYQDSDPQPIPLSRNKEFKSIRNAVIAAAIGLQDLPMDHSSLYKPQLTKAALSLLVQASRIFQSSIGYRPEPVHRFTDSKELEKIREMKEDLGQKMG